IPQLERLVKHEVNGLLVPPGDPSALAEAVLRILKDRALATELAANARALADRFDIRHTVARTAQLYRKLL
ncbi:MAG: glycosyltransferase, partial [Fimbriimonadales bacterium]|nr:glycosyltransferase [Fimbriimonadales bacterium]